MKLLFGILLFCFIGLLFCKAQIIADNYVDSITPSPYKIIRKSTIITLPDSLGGKKHKGFAYFQGVINDSTLKIQEAKVMKLKIHTPKGESVIDYYFGKEINNEDEVLLRKYLAFFEDYLNSLNIERIEGIGNNKSNVLTIPVKL